MEQEQHTAVESSPKLDVLRKNMEINRAQHVSEIFQIYDQLPELLSEFKTEGVTEEVAVIRLGKLIENILTSYELSQIPMIFDSIKEKERIKRENVSSIFPTSQPIGNKTKSGLYLP
jgi:hypothetical protein